MEVRCKNLFYFSRINSIGGIETFFYNLAQKYKDWDIVICYQIGDEEQLRRLRKYVRVIEFNEQKFICEKAFFNFNLDIIDYVEAKEYIQIAHGDYKAMGVRPNTHPRIDTYLGVSKQVCKTYEEVTGHKTNLVYNPIMVRKPERILHLISATRLTAEKGLDRIVTLADELDRHGVRFEWTIFTDAKTPLDNPSITYRAPRLDILDYIAESDYLVQLSDNEGYCYSVVESLMIGTPVIVTACPVFEEIGVVDGKNGFIVPFDMSNIPVEKITKGLPKFEYKPKEDTWSKILVKGESQYQKDMKTKVKIIATNRYYDLELDKQIEIGDVSEVSKVRADYIIESGYARYKSGNMG